MKMRLALEWVLGVSELFELNDHEIQGGIGFGHDEGLLPSPWVVSVSTKNLGGSASQGCRTWRMVHLLASYSH